MNRSFQEYFDKKIHETRFEVILKEKIEQTVLNKDHSQSGDITLHNCLELFN